MILKFSYLCVSISANICKYIFFFKLDEIKYYGSRIIMDL